MGNSFYKHKPSLSLEGAVSILDQALIYARDHELQVSVAIVDGSGNLVMFQRMDGAPLVSCDVAVGKARTAALIASPSEIFEDMINGGATAMLSVPGLLPLKGGLPVVVNGAVAGAIGVSGSSGENDLLTAEYAVLSFQSLCRQGEISDAA